MRAVGSPDRPARSLLQRTHAWRRDGPAFAALKASASSLVEAGYLLAEDVDTVVQSCLSRYDCALGPA
jgi:hypothetical protein